MAWVDRRKRLNTRIEIKHSNQALKSSLENKRIANKDRRNYTQTTTKFMFELTVPGPQKPQKGQSIGVDVELFQMLHTPDQHVQIHAFLFVHVQIGIGRRGGEGTNDVFAVVVCTKNQRTKETKNQRTKDSKNQRRGEEG